MSNIDRVTSLASVACRMQFLTMLLRLVDGAIAKQCNNLIGCESNKATPFDPFFVVNQRELIWIRGSIIFETKTCKYFENGFEALACEKKKNSETRICERFHYPTGYYI